MNPLSVKQSPNTTTGPYLRSTNWHLQFGPPNLQGLDDCDPVRLLVWMLLKDGGGLGGGHDEDDEEEEEE